LNQRYFWKYRIKKYMMLKELKGGEKI